MIKFGRKAVFIALLVLVGIALADMFLFFSQAAAETEPFPVMLRSDPAYSREWEKVYLHCGRFPDINADKCIYADAIKKNDLNLCRLIIHPEMRYTCAATMSRNLGICNQMKSTPPEFAERCRSYYYNSSGCSGFGRSQEEVEICLITKTSIWRCNDLVKIGAHNIENCRREAAGLIERKKTVPEECQALDPPESDWCLFEAAMESKNTEMCSFFYYESIGVKCLAVLTKDLQLCNEIPVEDPELPGLDLRAECIEAVQSVEAEQE